MTTMTLALARERVLGLGPCSDAREWVESLSRVSAKRVWERCERGDWLLWLAARAGVDRRLVVLAACDCARLALVHVPAGELRPLHAIETAERWARGDTDVSIQDLRKVASAASDAAAAAAYAAYAAASDAASDAAYDASAAASAAAAAAYAAASDAAYDAAYDASAAADARVATQQQCADLVRARITWDMVATALQEHAE